MKSTLMIAMLAFLLIACGDRNSDPSAIEAPQAEDQEALAEQPRELSEMDRSDPERRQAAMQAMREQRGEREMDPEQRERREELRERMRQRREEMMAEREGLEPGERLRERRAGARGNWWEDEEITERLELSETQAESLSQAHQTLNETQRESRQALADSQRQLRQSMQAVDREKIQQLLEERQAAVVALAEAENDWYSTLLHELSDEQIQTLAKDHPGALVRGR
ncbi:MAG: Spy/CpxP family protein refolding chaperone [Wenzhouxiangella sp.]